jgi:streptogramin lyase
MNGLRPLLMLLPLSVLACPTRTISDGNGGAGGSAGMAEGGAAGTRAGAGGHAGRGGAPGGTAGGQLGLTGGADGAAGHSGGAAGSVGGAGGASLCGGLGQACCVGDLCSIAGSVCGSSNVCGCPVGSHACRGNSCISNASLCDITEYPLPATKVKPKPAGLALGPDGNIWFTDSANLKVGRMVPTGSVVEFSVSQPPDTITAGPDGNLWFTEHGHPSGGTDQIGKMDTAGSHLDEFDVSADALSTDPGNTLGGGGMIITGPDHNLWFTESVPGKIARMTTAGVRTAYQVSAFYPQGLAVGPDQNIWYALHDGSGIGWLTTSGMDNTEIPLPNTTDDPLYLALAADNTFWITESTSNLVTHYVPGTGKITQYPIPTSGSFPGPIVLGPDGNMWSVGFISNNVIRISTAGVITEFPLPTADSQPSWIAKGPDISGSGTLWISEGASGKIARVIP